MAGHGEEAANYGRAFDDVSSLPAEVRLDGLPVYPRFAAEDFERAFYRFNILTGVEEAFGEDEEAQLAADGVAFPQLALYGTLTGHYIMPEEQALDFIQKTTGHPAGWVASWNYRVTLNDLAAESGGDLRIFLRASAIAYRDAVRYLRRNNL